MRKSILDSSNTVVNVIVLNPDSNWTPPDGQAIGPDGGNIGEVWTGTEYQKVVVEISEVTIVTNNDQEPTIL